MRYPIFSIAFFSLLLIRPSAAQTVDFSAAYQKMKNSLVALEVNATTFERRISANMNVLQKAATPDASGKSVELPNQPNTKFPHVAPPLPIVLSNSWTSNSKLQRTGFAVAEDLVVGMPFFVPPTDLKAGDPQATVSVITASGERLNGRVVAYDRSLNLALIHLDDAVLQPLSLVEQELQPGAPVVIPRFEVASGLVIDSAMIAGGKVSTHSRNGRSHLLTGYYKFEQIASPIVDSSGSVIAFYGFGQGNRRSAGQPIALPIKPIQRLIDQYRKGVDDLSILEKPRLGVILDTNDPCVIHEIVPSSPATQVKLQAGDRIKSINRQPCRRNDDVLALVAEHRAGDEITVEVQRDAEFKLFTATLDTDERTSVVTTYIPLGPGALMLKDGKLAPLNFQFPVPPPTSRPTLPPSARPSGQTVPTPYSVPAPQAVPIAPQIQSFQVERSRVEDQLRDITREQESFKAQLDRIENLLKSK